MLLLLHRMGMPALKALLLAASVQIAAMVTASYWWHNPVSCVAVTLLCTATFLVLGKPANTLNWMLYGFCLFLTSLAKPNVAGVSILTCSLALFVNQRTRYPGLLAAAAAFLCFLGLLWAYHINLFDMLGAYFGASGRGLPTFERFGQDQPTSVIVWSVILIVFSALPLLSHLFFSWKLHGSITRNATLLAVTTGCFLAGLYGCFTNGELKVMEIPMLFIPVALYCLRNNISDLNKRIHFIFSPHTLLYAALFLIVSTALWQGLTRYRVECIGIRAFYEDVPLRPVGPSNTFFKKLQTGPVLQTVLAEEAAVFSAIRRDLGREPRIFFGPRMNWGYAAFQLSPPLHLPYSWWAGVDYPAEHLDEIMYYFTKFNPDYCIFLGNQHAIELIYMPQRLISVLRSNYQICYCSDVLVILRRNDLQKNNKP